jgi:prepilin-type N-terminal cleavage/methylation domain-containing protein
MMRMGRNTAEGAGRRAKGFTLIETMISVVVLSIGILSLAAILAYSLALMNAGQFDYIAQQKAAEAIESWVRLPGRPSATSGPPCAPAEFSSMGPNHCATPDQTKSSGRQTTLTVLRVRSRRI